jgi:UPF0755 protein
VLPTRYQDGPTWVAGEGRSVGPSGPTPYDDEDDMADRDAHGLVDEDQVWDATPSGDSTWETADGRGPGPTADGSGERRRWLGLRHPVITFLVLALVGLLVAGTLTFVWAAHRINPPGKPGAVTTVVIPAGSSTSHVGSILSKAGVIKGGILWDLYVKVHGGGSLQAGTYQFHRNSSYGTVVDAMQAGPPEVNVKLTIPEGFTLAQIAQKVGELPGAHLSAARFLAAANGGEVRSPFEPAGSNNLEGLVFPATYQIRVGENEDDVLEQLVGAFDNEAASLGLVKAAANRGMTPYQLITVASIVEREAKLAGDRGDVASALYNRLAQNLPLGADSTLIYALRLTDPGLVPTKVDFNQQNTYNTRLHTGLPPTPIANPGVPSLDAAINPPTTNFLYFVEIDPSGKLGFAPDVAGFAKLQAQCQAAKLC